MRLFTVLVFDQIVRGTSEVVSSSEHNDLLGKAHDLVYEVEVEEATGTTPTLSLRHKVSNSGKGFIPMTDLLTTVALDTFPYRNIARQTGPLGAMGQVAVQLGGTSPVARVRIWVTGWSS
ncbi:MAG TPA: hypothetical protein PKY30_14200 [Myxococcota bacterium]|nr:hypothetical protein [Myxococcota bacterium]